MTFLYLSYLGITLIGALSVIHFGKIRFSPKQTKAILFSLGITTLIFTAWDILAVQRGHWSFGLEHTLNVLIVNQPLEEIGFFLIIPFFGLALYEYMKRGEKR